MHQVVDTHRELEDMARALADQIARNAPLALRAAKKVKQMLASDRTGDALHRAETIRRSLDSTADCLEGLAAFAEKRPPVFIGK